MRIKMTASGEELSVPTGHPLHGTHVRLLVWNYLTEGSEHNGKPSGATFTATPSTPSSHPNALSMHESDINSVLTVQAIADALHALDGHALWEAIQPLIPFSEEPPTETSPTETSPTETSPTEPLPDATKPKPKRGRPPKGTSHKFSGQQESPSPTPSPTPTPSPSPTQKESTGEKKRGRRKTTPPPPPSSPSPTESNAPIQESRTRRRKK